MLGLRHGLRVSLGLAGVVAMGLATSAGAVKLNSLFSDNAVLQRDMAVPVWGTGNNAEKVTVSFNGQKVSTTVKNGSWMVKLKPMKAGGPYTMTVSGDDTIELRNMMVGEVWICSGQSNMQFPLIQDVNGPTVVAGSTDKDLRLYTAQMVCTDKAQADANGSWQPSSPVSSPGFTAVGWFFGRDLRKALGVPVGLINTSWGGSFAEAWTSPAVLKARPDLQKITPEICGQPPHVPSGLYNGMLHPLIPFAVRGAIWYQGESNAGQAYTYRELFPTMIKNWRDDWGQGEFPFYFVQLAPLEFAPHGPEPYESAWAELREAQFLTTRVCPKTGMAVITDVGDPADIHPRRKEPVGGRLALLALARDYGQSVECCGPELKSMVVRDDRAVLTFDHATGGLIAKGGPLKGFAVAGADHKFYWANASIVGDRVVVSSPAVSVPVAVRYGWSNCPDVNLYNGSGLPASPFRTDDFQMVTGPRK